MISNKELEEWLTRTAWDLSYWNSVKIRAKELNSDGCSGVPDWFVWTCQEHDVHYRTHKFLDGRELVKETADYIFRRRIQQVQMSVLKWPISWIRWVGVYFFGSKGWNNGGLK